MLLQMTIPQNPRRCKSVETKETEMHNILSYQLTTAEEDALKKGVNFCPTCKTDTLVLQQDLYFVFFRNIKLKVSNEHYTIRPHSWFGLVPQDIGSEE